MHLYKIKRERVRERERKNKRKGDAERGKNPVREWERETLATSILHTLLD